MNIKTFLEPKLWDEIENNYKNEDYTGAITNAIYYLRDIIREKANLDLDTQLSHLKKPKNNSKTPKM